MSEQGNAAGRKPDKRKQGEARDDLENFLQKLKQACATMETANDWADSIKELNNLLEIYKFEIPADRENGLLQAMNLVNPTREGIIQACNVLELEIEKTIESLPGRGRGCGCMRGGLAAIAIGLAVVVGLVIAAGYFILQPVEVNVVNAGCGPMFVRQGIPVQLQPVVNFLGVDLPDIIDTDGEGRFQVPGLPLRVGVNGSGRSTVVVSTLGVNVPFEISENTAFIEVNGKQIFGNSFSVGVREHDPHNVIIGCE